MSIQCNIIGPQERMNHWYMQYAMCTDTYELYLSKAINLKKAINWNTHSSTNGDCHCYDSRVWVRSMGKDAEFNHSQGSSWNEV